MPSRQCTHRPERAHYPASFHCVLDVTAWQLCFKRSLFCRVAWRAMPRPASAEAARIPSASFPQSSYTSQNTQDSRVKPRMTKAGRFAANRRRLHLASALRKYCRAAFTTPSRGTARTTPDSFSRSVRSSTSSANASATSRAGWRRGCRNAPRIRRAAAHRIAR